MNTQGEPLLAFADELRDASKLVPQSLVRKCRNSSDRRFIPRAKDDTATVSFIELEQRTYAVTAYHVIKGFRSQAEEDGVPPEGYFLPAAPGVLIEPPFVRPPANLPHPQPDIALRPIDRSKLPARKRFHKLNQLSPTFPVPYALAAGFPTAAKETLPNSAGEQLKLLGVVAIAEGVGSSPSSDQVQFYSEVTREKISGDVNGMSGGPVFWSDGTAYGLLGFVKEAMAEQNANDEMAKVHFSANARITTCSPRGPLMPTKLLPKAEQLNARLATGSPQR
jgi:hypothetical protein